MASTSKCSIGVYLNEECHKTTYNSQIGSRHIDRFDYKDQLLIKPRCGIDKPLTDICNQHEPQVQLYFRENHHNTRRYNRPIHHDVAAVFVEGQDGGPPNHEMVIRSSDDHLQQLPYYSTNCVPMSYPLIFLRDEPGWIPRSDLICLMEIGNTLQLGKYTAYHLLYVKVSSQSSSVATCYSNMP